MFKSVELGHVYSLINRSDDGSYVGNQLLTFIEVRGDAVSSVGVFTQDVIEVLIDRLEWQTENCPYRVSEIEVHRKKALVHLQRALDSMERFTLARKADGAKLLGHISADE
jgi:hypothetical protein